MSSTATTPPELRPDDFLAIDALLSDEERDIRDAVRAFVADRVVPHVGDWFEQATVPAELAPELGRLGVLGMHLTGYGCAGASATAYGLACMELEAGDSGVRSLVSVQGSLAMFAIWRYGSEAQKQRWLPRMAAGEAIGCFGLTEPDAGSDPGRDAHARAPRRRRLDPARREDVDHQRVARRRRRRVGADRRGRARVPRRARHARLHHPGHPPQALAARLDHLRAAAGRRAPARRRAAPRGDRPARAAVVPERGALRDRLRRRRRGARLPGGGAGLQQGAHRLRPADRRDADPAGQARRHGAGGQPRDAAGAASGPHEGRRARCAPSTCRWASSATSTAR